MKKITVLYNCDRSQYIEPFIVKKVVTPRKKVLLFGYRQVELDITEFINYTYYIDGVKDNEDIEFIIELTKQDFLETVSISIDGNSDYLNILSPILFCNDIINNIEIELCSSNADITYYKKLFEARKKLNEV